jgi:hypothetical protein
MSSSAAMVGYATAGASLPWGGDMRHHQGDLDGGTDLYDARTALAAYGVTLTIRSGAGWSALVADHDAGHPLVVQGGGRDVPGAGSYSGGHACAIGVGEDSGGRWLLGDPLTDAWQWIAPGDIKAWMEAWQGSCAWGRIPKVATTPPPDQPPDPAPPGQPCPPCPPEDCTDELTRYQDALVGAWMTWLAAPRPGAADVWDGGAWSSPPLAASAILDDPCPPDPTLAPAAWSRGVPFPLSDALEAQATDPAWDGADWRQVAWA